MAEPFMSEVRLFSFSFAPKGWALCNGQLLPINQNQALFSLLGTTFGGDGRVNFGLPNLQGRVPTHVGSGFTLGEQGGEQAHTLTSQEENHTHGAKVSTNPADRTTPAGNLWAVAGAAVYGDGGGPAMSPLLTNTVGGSQPHLNMSPFLTISFCIALQGIFPSST